MIRLLSNIANANKRTEIGPRIRRSWRPDNSRQVVPEPVKISRVRDPSGRTSAQWIELTIVEVEGSGGTPGKISIPRGSLNVQNLLHARVSRSTHGLQDQSTFFGLLLGAIRQVLGSKSPRSLHRRWKSCQERHDPRHVKATTASSTRKMPFRVIIIKTIYD